eukprot:c1020_g1_i1.p1 GENE.c1020_g1_i1~~c1020_g1_i1.p1  ORF type:complete len:301 (-),score=82.47 c1020_g1_i1:326-1228(-)
MLLIALVVFSPAQSEVEQRLPFPPATCLDLLATLVDTSQGDMLSLVQRADAWMTSDVSLLSESVDRLEPITSRVASRMEERHNITEKVQQQLVLLMSQKDEATAAVEATRARLAERTAQGKATLHALEEKINHSKKDELTLLNLGKWFENDPSEEAKLISAYKPHITKSSQNANETLAELQQLIHETTIDLEKQYTEEAHALFVDKKILMTQVEEAETNERVIGAKIRAFFERNQASQESDSYDGRLLSHSQQSTAIANEEIEYTQKYWSHRKTRLANIAFRMHSLSILFHKLHDLVATQ